MKRFYSIFLLIALAIGGTVKAGELKIGSNDTSTKTAPVNGGDADRYQYHNQTIFLASELTALANQQITKITFFQKSNKTSSDFANVQISLMEVSNTSFEDLNFLSTSGAQVVYTGSLPSSSSLELEVTLSSEYEYKGGNLLVDVQKTQPSGGGYGSYSWKGFQATSKTTYFVLAGAGTSSGLPSEGNRSMNRPDIKFTYEEVVVAGCANMGTLTTSDITANSATVSWDAVTDVENYQSVCVLKGAEVDWTDVTPSAATSVNLTSLKANTEYDVYVRTYCSADEGKQGAAKKVAFTTEKSCYEPKNLGVSNIEKDGATISWAASGKGETEYQYTYEVYSDETPNWEGAPTTTETSATLSGLNSSTPYQVWVRSYCAAADQSEAITEYFTTLVDCSAQALPLNEDFSNEDNIACWKLTDCASSTGVSSGKFQFQYTKTPPQYLISPELIASAKQVKVEFDYWCYSSSNEESFQVGYSTTTNETDAFTWGTEYKTTNTISASPDEFSEVLPAGIKFIAIKCTSDYKYYLYIDNFSATEYEAPACPNPADVKATYLDSISANITWTNGGEETSWKLRYSTDNENWTDANEGNAFTTKPYKLTGLKASTQYYVQVASVCGVSDESEWSAAGSFTTDCNAADELNEAFSSSLPDCWKVTKTGGDYSWAPSSSYKVSASYSMYYYATAAASEYSDLITPNVNLGDKESNLTFYLKNDGYYGAVPSEVYIVVGASTTKLVDLGATSGWALQTIDLSAYAGKIAKFIFRAHGLGAYSSIYIDDVAISVKPCNKPTGLAAAASKGSATITWTDEEADKWNLQYRIVAKPENVWTEVKGLTAQNHTLESLDEEAEYEVQVQAVCSATRSSDWTASVKFKPVCPTPGAITITDKTYNSATASWTAGGAETAWNVQIKEGEGEYGASIPVTEPTYALAGLTTGTQYSIRVQASCGGDWSAVANYTPAYTEPEVAAATSITETSATVAWGAVADAAGYEVALTLRGVAASEWKATTKTDTTFSNLAAKTDYDVFVRAKYDTGESTADSIGFSTIAVAPTDLVQGTTTTESISFSWSYAGAATQFQYKVNDGDWSAPQTALTATVNGLNSGTTYTIYVRAYYADGKESSELSGSFATECAVKKLGWSENFEASSSIPACWEGGSDVTIAASSGVSNSNALRLRAYSAVQAATPEIKISEAAVLNFSYQSSSATGAVYINSVAEENKVATLSTSTKFKEVSVDLAAYNGQDIKVIFYGNSTGNNRYIYIDNVEVIEKPCAAISNLTATAALDSVVLAWESDAEAFEYCVVEGSAEAAGWQATAAKTVTVKGLTPETAYTAYVRSSCSETKKGEATGKAFTPACPAPTAAEASAVTTTTAKLSWTAAAGITHYQYKLNDEDWVAEHVVEGTSVELSALTPGTAYKFYVRSYYSAAVQSTATSVDFTTECAAQALPFNEDFEGAITCWTLVDCHSDSKVSGGVFQFYFSSNPPQYLISPELVPSEKNVKVQFEYKAKNSTWEESFQVGYSTTTKETTAFTWSDTTFCNVTDYQEYSDVLPAGVRFIAIKYTADDKDHLYIDNFSATETSEATAIDNIGAGIKSDAIKYMENGVLYIIRDGIKYNAQGAQVSK